MAAVFAPSTTSTMELWDMQSSSDPLLSDILDEVVEFAPDSNTDLASLLEAFGNSQNNNCQQREALAINIIQKSLMQCESVVSKTPPSPSISMSSTPPAYSSASVRYHRCSS